MRPGAISAPALSCLFLTACTTHPLVNDRTGLSTAGIVHKVRCEARERIKKFATAEGFAALELEFKNKEKELKKEKAEIAKHLKDLGAKLEDGTMSRAKYEKAKWLAAVDLVTASNGILKVENAYRNFAKQTIAYDFRFLISEKNISALDVGIVWPIHFGTARIGGGYDETRDRSAERKVFIAETFEQLLKLEDCSADARAVPRRAGRYPIAGSIGLSETIDQYIALRDTKRLDQARSAFEDKVTFITEVGADVGASVTLTPSRARTISGGLSSTNVRKDTHEVLVKIAPNVERKEADPPEFVLAQFVEVRLVTDEREAADRPGGPKVQMQPQADGAEARSKRGFATTPDGAVAEPAEAIIRRTLRSIGEAPSDDELVNRALRDLEDRQRLDADQEIRDFLRNR